MAIIAKNTAQTRELIETGLHVARCFKMIELGTCTENVMGQIKQLQKVNLTWELPLLTKVFDEAKGPQPLVISKEYTVSMGEKANLRKALESWRGKPFTEEQAKSFDITILLGQPCMLNITHKPSKADASKIYEEISAITPPMKGLTIPAQVNPSVELSYDKWNEKMFEELPQFIKDKMVTTPEYLQMRNPNKDKFVGEDGQPLAQDLPSEFYQDEPESSEPLF